MELSTACAFENHGVRGEIHSAFEHAINLCFEFKGGTRLFTILPSGSPGLPDSVTVCPSIFSKLLVLTPGTPVWKQKDQFLLDGEGISFKGERAVYSETPVRRGIARDRAELFCKQWTEYRVLSGRTSGFDSFFPETQKKIEKVLAALGTALLKHMEFALLDDLNRYIGLGKGLTPSFDDALVGVMCCSSARIQDSVTPLFGGRKKFYSFIKGKTTEVSCKYLCCACENRYSQKLVELTDAISCENRPDLMPCIERAAETGATSGMDMLWGIAAVCKSIIGNQETPYGLL